MEKMIESTLAFAREDAEKEKPEFVDISALVESLCEDFAATGRPVECEEIAAFKYTCRPLALKRAISNIVDNAVKYGGGAKGIMRWDAESIDIIVEDDGPGIPEAELNEVFAPFYRLEQSRSRETGGVGLGLSLARSVAHGHGGEIILSNRVDGGLCATIQLPR